MLVDRYLSRHVVIGVLVALLALLGVGFFLTFLSQIHNIGTGNFTVSTAFAYAALTMPQTAYDMLPVATLIGSVFALGGMAANRELMILRVSGAGMPRLARAVAWSGLVLAVGAVILGEFVAPPAKRTAETLRIQKMYSQINSLGPGGVWIKSGNSIVHVLKVETPTELSGVRIFALASGQSLQSVREAASATWRDGQWTLRNVVGTRIGTERTEPEDAKSQPWPQFVGPSTFRTLVVDPENLSWRGLLRYLSYLRSNHLATARYETAFWHKMAAPVSVLIMVLLALPFSLGRMRATGSGQRLALGVVIGLAYYLVDRTVLEAGQAFRIAPVLSAWTPTVLLAVVVALALRRVR